MFFFPAGLQINHACRSESRADTETHGRGEETGCSGGEGVGWGGGGPRPDRTRRTTHRPRTNKTAPQIKMHPGHSICVPLPSSQREIHSVLVGAFRFMPKKKEAMDTGLRGWREKGALTHTYPDQRGQSWTSIYTCLHLAPQSNGSGGHFTQEKQWKRT